MIYANDQASIIFPFSPSTGGEPTDNTCATLTRKFFMSETEVTNALMVKVLQWAYDNDKFSTTVGDPNGLNSTTVKHGGKQLLDLSNGDMKISYNTETNKFSVTAGYEDHPVVCVTWYGVIMFCNWLTEMRDGNTANVVYTNIDTTWEHEETGIDDNKTGYRLPSSEEWEYAARYIGTTEPTEENLASEYVARGLREGHETLTEGYYWTPGNYASGAIKENNPFNLNETRLVGWCKGDPGMGEGGDKLMPVGLKRVNQLGLYDMSGNVWELCSNLVTEGNSRVKRGGSWKYDDQNMSVGVGYTESPTFCSNNIGFRFARTQ
jgi:formylglycine-generating enzyme required for sulfatase activity